MEKLTSQKQPEKRLDDAHQSIYKRSLSYMSKNSGHNTRELRKEDFSIVMEKAAASNITGFLSFQIAQKRHKGVANHWGGLVIVFEN